MQQQKKKGAVIKGLAFPIGYTVFMNVFQYTAIALIAAFCFIRVFLAFAIAPDGLGSETLQNIFMQDYSITVTNLTYLLSAVTTVVALVILWLVFNRKGRNFVEYFRFKPTSFKAILCAALMGLSLFFIVSGIMTVLQIAAEILIQYCLETLREISPEYAYKLEEIYRVYTEALNMPADTGMFIIAAVFGAPLIEELTFRAGPLTNLTKRMPALPAIMITSALFAMAHSTPSQQVYTFFLGVVMGFLFVKTDSIYPCIVCHFVFNGANLISVVMGALFDMSSWQDHPAFEPHVQEVLTAASEVTFWVYLVLSVLIAVPMLIVGIILLVSLRRPAPEQPATEPIAEPIAEPVAETPVEPSSEPSSEPVQDYGIDPTVDPTVGLTDDIPQEDSQEISAETMPVEQMVEALDIADGRTSAEQNDVPPSIEAEETV